MCCPFENTEQMYAAAILCMHSKEHTFLNGAVSEKETERSV